MTAKKPMISIKLKNQPTNEIKIKLKNQPTNEINLNDSSIENIYEKMKHRDHILHEPSMYVGSVETTEQEMFIFDQSSKQMIKKLIKFVPGLYKIFDEGIVNTRDHFVRMNEIIEKQRLIIEGKISLDPKIDVNRHYQPVKNIEITVDRENNLITFRNDGDGIDVAWHQKELMYVPELIFGNLLSGTNFDKNE